MLTSLTITKMNTNKLIFMRNTVTVTMHMILTTIATAGHIVEKVQDQLKDRLILKSNPDWNPMMRSMRQGQLAVPVIRPEDSQKSEHIQKMRKRLIYQCEPDSHQKYRRRY
eukprot:NODE_15_length_42055_cov_0.634117.p23 type:complete len:111 gc:universal NODE_15_length_42055_cov_0.634117:7360-7692(+)